MEKRTFIFQDTDAQKFWSIEVKDKEFTVVYGKLGTDGKTLSKTFDSMEICQKEADKLILQKTKKGYAELIGGAAIPKKQETNSEKTTAIRRILKAIVKASEKGEDLKVDGVDVEDAYWWTLGKLSVKLFGQVREVDVKLCSYFEIVEVGEDVVEAFDEAAENLKKTEELEKTFLKAYRDVYASEEFISAYKELHIEEPFGGKLTDEKIIEDIKNAKLTIATSIITSEVVILIESESGDKKLEEALLEYDEGNETGFVALIVMIAPGIYSSGQLADEWYCSH